MRILLRHQSGNEEAEGRHADRCERLSKLSTALDDAWAATWPALAGRGYEKDKFYALETLQEVINYVDAFAYREGCPQGFAAEKHTYRAELHREPGA